jgi:hypothetical protein
METKWNGTIERRQGSGRPSTFTAEEDNMLSIDYAIALL